MHPEIKSALQGHHKCLPPTPVPTEEIRCRMDGNGKPYMHVDLPSVGVQEEIVSVTDQTLGNSIFNLTIYKGMPLCIEVVTEPVTANRNANDRATMHIPIDPDWLSAIAKNRPQPSKKDTTPATPSNDVSGDENDNASIELLGKVCFMNSLGDWSPPSNASAFRYTPPPPTIEDILKPEEEMAALDQGLAKSARKLAKMLKANEKEKEQEKIAEEKESSNIEKRGKEGRLASKKSKLGTRPTTASSVGDRGNSSPRMPAASSTPDESTSTAGKDKVSSTSKKTRPQSARPASTSNKREALPAVTPPKISKTPSKNSNGKAAGKIKNAGKLPATTPPQGVTGLEERQVEEGEFSFAQLMLDDAKRSEAEATASTNGQAETVQEGEFSLADLIADNERREAEERASTVQEGEFSLANMMADDAARGGTGAGRVNAAPVVQEGEFSLADMMADDAARGSTGASRVNAAPVVQEGEFSLADMMADDAARGGTGASRVGGRPKPSTKSSTSKIGGKDAPYALGARVTANYQGQALGILAP